MSIAGARRERSDGLAETALTVPELAAALDAIGGFEARPLIAVAVSGGPDSLALMLLADRWARQRGGTAWGLTVDHGLRPRKRRRGRKWSAAGLRRVRHPARDPRLGRRPSPPAASRRRRARRGIACLPIGVARTAVLHLLTAHHREDQAETYLIRRRAGSGVDGLAGMSAVRELPGCRLVRPLLAVPRAVWPRCSRPRASHSCATRATSTPIFERARLRLTFCIGQRQLARSPAFRAEPARAHRRSDPCVRLRGRRRCSRRTGLDETARCDVELWPSSGSPASGPSMRCSAAPWRCIRPGSPRSTCRGDRGRRCRDVERLLARVAACIGGARYPARRDRLARLREGLTRAAGPGPHARRLPFRAVARPDPGDARTGRRERAGALAARLKPCVWDRRFAVSLADPQRRALSCSAISARADASSRRGYERRSAAPRPSRAAGVLGRERARRGAASGLSPRGYGALPSLSFRPANAADTRGLYSCLMAGASYVCWRGRLRSRSPRTCGAPRR